MNNKKSILITVFSLLFSVSAYAIQTNDGRDIWYDINGFDTNGDNNLWAGGEPNDSGDCGQMYTSGGNAGKFDDADCDYYNAVPAGQRPHTKRALCFNGSNWQLTSGSVGMGLEGNRDTSLGDAVAACPLGYQFAAPRNIDEVNQVLAISGISGVGSIWVNLNDKSSEGSWVGNTGLSVSSVTTEATKGTVTLWAPGEPNNSGDCSQLYTSGSNSGLWDDTNCSTNRPVACFNGVEWRLGASGNVGSNNSAGMGNAQARCQSIGSAYEFAAPSTLEESQAIAALTNSSVWINLQDKEKENIWIFNEGSTVNTSPWNSGEPNNSGDEDCVVAVGSNGNWNDLSCSSARRVACENRGTNTWEITAGAVEMTQIDDLHRLCSEEYGSQYEFSAPQSATQQNALNVVRSSAGNPDVWVNANDQEYEGFWQINWGKANWADGHPVNPDENQCAQIRNSDGKWISARCEDESRVLCSDGSGWRLGDFDTHQYTNTALIACPRVQGLTISWELTTPRSAGAIEQVSSYVRSQSGNFTAWLNGKYLSDIGYWSWNSDEGPYLRGGDLSAPVWYDLFEQGTGSILCGFCDVDEPRSDFRSVVRYEDGQNFDYDDIPAGTSGSDNNDRLFNYLSFLNSGAFTFWNAIEPNYSGRCAQMVVTNEGKWDDIPCDNQLKAACSDGYEWRISPVATQVNPAGNSTDSSENLDPAQNACALVEKDGVAGNFKFAAPLSYRDSLDLSNLAQKEGVTNLWINVQSLRHQGTWKFNKGFDVVAPFWNAGEPNNGGSSANQHCAQLYTSGQWDDVSCNAANRRFACYDPYSGVDGKWLLTSSADDNGVLGNDIDAANKVCQNLGGRYKYYAPVTLTQNSALTQLVAAHGSSVWINANDESQENSWVLNSQLNNWEIAQPAGSASGKCVSSNAYSSHWKVRDCSLSLPVACTTGGRWYFTTTPVSMADFGEGQRQCDLLGDGYIFASPKAQNQFDAFRYYAEQSGVGGDYWINGYRQGTGNDWSWNIQQLYVPAWGDNEPNGNGSETCATLSSSNWADQACFGNTYKYLCRDGAGNWAVSDIDGELDDFANGVTACSDLGTGWMFAAPETYNENLAARDVVAATGGQVWLNATDALKEGKWLLNAANIGSTNNLGDTYTNWLGGSASGSTADNCVYQDANGQWSDISCAVADNYSWACTNGDDWRVTAAQGRIEQFADGHKACFNEFGNRFIFAAPLSKNDAIQLDFARKLTEQEANIAIGRVWLNLTDGGVGQEDKFRYNLPFVNWSGAVYPPGVEPINDCILKGATPAGSNNPWQVADCVTQAAHYACFSGSTWKVATSKGALVGGSLQIIPQIGEDYWSYERGNQLCKEQHGSEYYFSAPVTAAEELALDTAIRNADAQTRNTWINYYYVRSLTSNNNRWFADRVTIGNWQQTDFDNFSGSDCVALKKVSATHAVWEDAQCNDSGLKYSCLDLDDASWQLTAASGSWKGGFEQCDTVAALYAAPRSPDELKSLLDNMSVGDSAWINATDTAVESQWIVNRLRSAWWADDQPQNNGNKDCALVNPDTGLWQSEKCNAQEYQFACRHINGANIEWAITADKGLWSQGFGICAREFEGYEFMAPVGYGNTLAKVEQDSLAALVTGSAAAPVWINYSDQDIEGAWRTERAYNDWGVASLLDEQNDCGYYDRVVQGTGTWYADRCKYTAASAMERGFACTDGYEWRIVETSATTNQRWSAGFDACQALGSEWVFSAPADGVDNAKLKLALELAGQSQAWINIQDRTGEGDWVINGPQTNFPIEIEIVAAEIVAEQTNAIELRANLTDDEEQQIPAVADGILGWELVEAESDLAGFTAADFSLSSAVLTGNTAAGEGVLTATYNTPRLFKNDVTLVFRVFTTDTKPGPSAEVKTSEARISVTVKAPLIAAYDFEDPLALNKDVSGNGHDAFNSQLYPLPAVADGALQLTANSVMRVAGTATYPEDGLVIPADEYTIAMRISVEESHDDDGNNLWRGIFQKGNVSNERQPGLFLFDASDRLHARNSTSVGLNRGGDSTEDVALQQWINVVYMKRTDGLDVYVDDLVTPFVSYDYDSDVNETVVDNNGDFWVGNIPGAAESFVGFADDIHIFDRTLNATELSSLLVAPPVGEIAFVTSASQIDEDAGAATIEVERRRGYRGAFSSTFSLSPDSPTTATVGAVADIATDVDVALAGGSVTVNWDDQEKGTKTFAVTLDASDDGIPEGGERVNILIDSATGNQISADDQHLLNLNDVTPNPNGNFSVFHMSSPAQAPEYSSVIVTDSVVLENETAPQYLCVVRESGGVGEVTINYTLSGTASRGADNLNDDYNLIAGSNRIVPGAGASVTGQVVFADGVQTPQCFEVAIYNHESEIGEADRLVNVELTSVSPTDSAHTPILTQDRSSQIIIRDYAVGKIEFAAASGTCWEPNAAPACSTVTAGDEYCLPDTIETQFDETATCEVTIVRSGTGTAAPAQTVTLDLSAAVPGDLSGSSDLTLNFPAISPDTLASPATETQTIQLGVVTDNRQEPLNDQLTLELTGVAQNLGAQTSYELTIKDVTTPAVINIAEKVDIAGKTYEVEDGSAFNIDILRSGNAETEFTLTRELATSKTGTCTLAELLDLSGDFTAQTTTAEFARGNTDDLSWQIKPRKVYDVGANYTVSLTLSAPEYSGENMSRVVGFGSADMANSNSPSTSRAFTIGGDDTDALDGVASPGLVQVHTGAEDILAGSAGSNEFYAISKQVAERSEITLSSDIAAISGLNTACADGVVHYSWVFVNPVGYTNDGNPDNDTEISSSAYDGANFAGVGGGSVIRNRSIPMSSLASAQRAEINLKLPFTYTNDVQTIVRLKVHYGNTASFGSAYVTKYFDIPITTKPRWRQLVSLRSDECVGPDGERYEGNLSCNGSANRLWTYDPINKLMLNMGDQACARSTGGGTLGQGGRLFKTSYNGSTPQQECTDAVNKWEIFKQDPSNTTRISIRQQGGSNVWCNYGNFRIDPYYNTGNCNGDDDFFAWGND